MTETEVKQAALKMPLATGGKAKKKIAAKPLIEDDFVKALLVGHSGSGKTRTIADILLSTKADGTHYKVFVASTDLGGNGLRTVKDRLLAVGRTDLLANVVNVDFTSYEDFAAFTSGQDVVDINGQSLWAWNPDVFFWDGFSNFQESQVWRYVMAIDSIANNPGEAREEGIQAGQAEWGQIRRCSLLQIDQFLTLHNPNGKKVSKLVSVLLDDGKEDKFTHETKKGPLVLGATRSYMPAAFDLILNLKMGVKPGTKVTEYSYTADVGGAAVAKVRGNESRKLPEAALKGADFKALWAFFTAPPTAEPTV